MNHRLVFGTRRIGKGFSYRSNLTALGTLLLLGAIVIIVIASTPGQPAMAHHAQPTVHFSDVATTESYYAGVEHLANHGVISGYSNGTFLPNNYASRGQMSKIIVNAEGWSINLAGAPHFTDVDSANPFYTFIETAYNRGMISVAIVMVPSIPSIIRHADSLRRCLHKLVLAQERLDGS